MKAENIAIKTNIDIHHVCLPDVAIRRMHRTYDATFAINTLYLKVKVHFFFTMILCPGLSILRPPFK